MADTPDMETILIENPAPGGPFGAKGVGELPMDGGAPALLQAIENATGLRLAAIPATPERIFEASRTQRTA
jgi:CO/xanthine dehydrogenase Mo-binding subunit